MTWGIWGPLCARPGESVTNVDGSTNVGQQVSERVTTVDEKSCPTTIHGIEAIHAGSAMNLAEGKFQTPIRK